MKPGKENKRNTSLNLMGGRLGNFYSAPRQIDGTKDQITTSLEGIEHQSNILVYNGGHQQQNRMILDKRRSLDRALVYSYQGADVVNTLPESKPARALINPNKLKQDYDDKIISIGFEHGFKTGDVFKWLDTNTYWIIYLQDLTELAYFRGDIRRCKYKISFNTDDGIQTTYAAIRGPVETKINYIQKHGISVDTPNHSLNILLPATKETLEYFRRYSKFYLQDMVEGSPRICWRVESTDWISMQGILEINAVEYYANEDEDDLEKGIVGGLIVKEDIPEEVVAPGELHIEGEQLIKTKQSVTFIAKNTLVEQEWIIENPMKTKVPLPIKISSKTGRTITLKWDAYYGGKFTLKYGTASKDITVESLY